MKKYLFIFLFISSSLSADYLFTGKSGRSDFAYCIKSHFFTYKKNKLYLSFDYGSRKNGLMPMKTLKNYKIESGYILKNNICKKVTQKLSNFRINSNIPLNVNTLSYLGLSDNDLNLIFAFSGLLTSFLFIFGLFRWI